MRPIVVVMCCLPVLGFGIGLTLGTAFGVLPAIIVVVILYSTVGIVTILLWSRLDRWLTMAARVWRRVHRG